MRRTSTPSAYPCVHLSETPSVKLTDLNSKGSFKSSSCAIFSLCLHISIYCGSTAWTFGVGLYWNESDGYGACSMHNGRNEFCMPTTSKQRVLSSTGRCASATVRGLLRSGRMESIRLVDEHGSRSRIRTIARARDGENCSMGSVNVVARNRGRHHHRRFCLEQVKLEWDRDADYLQPLLFLRSRIRSRNCLLHSPEPSIPGLVTCSIVNIHLEACRGHDAATSACISFSR